MPPSVNSKAVQVPAMIRESDGATLIWTTAGYRTPEEAGVVIDNAASGGGGSGGATMPAGPFNSGTLAAAQLVVPLAGARIPCLVSVYSTNVARAIEVSISGAAGPWETGTYDVDSSTRRSLNLTSAATHVRITGAIGDAWSIL